MTVPTIEQYKEAIQEVLLPRQITALQILYYFPDATATAKDLAMKIHPSNPAPITAAGSIGRLGKRIADYLRITPRNYFQGAKERPAYYTLVSEKYQKNVGWTMHSNLKTALEELKLVDGQNSEIYERLPTETLPFEDRTLHTEGKAIQVFVNRYERNQNARIECIRHYGHKCQVCEFDFGEAYGDIADGFIHVHHIKPLADTKKEYKVDPIKHLVPLCANCHSAVHLTKPAMKIKELKRRMQR